MDLNFAGEHGLACSMCPQEYAIVKSLLDRPNVDPESVHRSSGRSALMHVCGLQKPDLVKLFLDGGGVNVNQQDNTGHTALCRAAIYSCLETAKLLLDRDDTGRTALHRACSLDPKSLSIVNLLLKRDDIDHPNSRDSTSNGETPLTCACFIKCVPIVRSLLSHRATDPTPIGRTGVSLLCSVIYNNQGSSSRRNYFSPPCCRCKPTR